MTPKVLRYDVTTNEDGTKSRFIIVAVTNDTLEGIARSEHTFTEEENQAMDADESSLNEIVETAAAEAYVNLQNQNASPASSVESADADELQSLTSGIRQSAVLSKATEIKNNPPIGIGLGKDQPIGKNQPV